jgi:HEAT repeat protein
MLLHMRVRAALWAVGCVLAGCAPAVSSGGFHAPDPASRMYAIEAAVRANDRSATPHIIEQLDSDDPAVRLVAICALERLTGETHGYCAYAPRHEREAAIARWIEASQHGTAADTTEGAAPHGG